MAEETQTLSGIIVGANPRKDRYVHWEVFCPTHGIASVTLPQKLATPYGIFDEVELLANTKSKSFFANEIHLIDRPDALARRPEGFMQAGALAALLKKAFNHMPDYTEVFDIFKKALGYYAEGLPAKAVTLKAFYLMLRAEGFGAKEDWLERLPASQLTLAKAALYAPLADAPNDLDAPLHSLTLWASSELGFRI